jgi:hypothetical protein
VCSFRARRVLFGIFLISAPPISLPRPQVLQHLFSLSLSHPLSLKLPPHTPILIPPYVFVSLSLSLSLYISLSLSFTPHRSEFVAAERVREDREGAVAYFLDADGRVIGLWKLKTAWYILVRAIREKVCAIYLSTSVSSFVAIMISDVV